MNGAGTTTNRITQNTISPGSKYTPMRSCKGECNGQRRSIKQFVGDENICIKCKKRMPK